MNKRQILDLAFSALLGASISLHLFYYYKFEQKTTTFVNQGKRFTAKDGQTLCERIRVLESKNNLTPESCFFDR